MIITADLPYQFDSIPDRLGDWRRDTPWRRKGVFWKTTFSRTAIDNKQQKAQVRVRDAVFREKDAIHEVAGQLRAADFVDRETRRHTQPLKRGARA